MVDFCLMTFFTVASLLSDNSNVCVLHSPPYATCACPSVSQCHSFNSKCQRTHSTVLHILPKNENRESSFLIRVLSLNRETKHLALHEEAKSWLSLPSVYMHPHYLSDARLALVIFTWRTNRSRAHRTVCGGVGADACSRLSLPVRATQQLLQRGTSTATSK